AGRTSLGDVRQWTEVLRLVEADRAGARRLELRHEAESFVLGRPEELDTLLLEFRDRALDVVAHEEQLVLPGLTAPAGSRVDSELTRRQLEDQPAGVRLHMVETQHVAEERACRITVLRKDERVDAGDHRPMMTAWEPFWPRVR